MAIASHGYFDLSGTCTSIGERPILSLINPEAMARMSVGEMLTNMIWVRITRIEDIKCSANWMWPGKTGKNGYHLCKAAIAMSEMMESIGIAIDGGKDSMSMSVSKGDIRIDAPGSLVISGYVNSPDFRIKVEPCFQEVGNHIVYVDLGFGMDRMGGSSMLTSYHNMTGDSPDIKDHFGELKKVFCTVQDLISEGKILSGHDRSDGGMIVSLIEMSISSGIGFKVFIDGDPQTKLFSEELGLFLEVRPEFSTDVVELLRASDVPTSVIGTTGGENIIVYNQDKTILKWKVSKAADEWDATSTYFESRQRGEEFASDDRISRRSIPYYKLSDEVIISLTLNTDSRIRNIHNEISSPHTVAVIREEGSNGDAEMAAAFHQAGFQVWDINMNDLIGNPGLIDRVRGIALVGGFSFSDVLGAGRGWERSIMSNTPLRQSMNRFYKRTNTFSLGVCNGCQVMGLLGWVPSGMLKQNSSGKFESRFSTVKISKSNSIMLRGMEETIVGVWVAHGEGRFDLEGSLNVKVPIHYADDEGDSTDKYPFCPNGSTGGAAAVVSDNGRHLAMMPHPERCFLGWQMPWHPREWSEILECNSGDTTWKTPWAVMFKNAFEWCGSIYESI